MSSVITAFKVHYNQQDAQLSQRDRAAGRVCTRVMDRQTDAQTDGQTDIILIARPRLHCMQRCKNWGLIRPSAPALGLYADKINNY